MVVVRWRARYEMASVAVHGSQLFTQAGAGNALVLGASIVFRHLVHFVIARMASNAQMERVPHIPSSTQSHYDSELGTQFVGQAVADEIS
jgi:hypothetical protein